VGCRRDAARAKTAAAELEEACRTVDLLRRGTRRGECPYAGEYLARLSMSTNCEPQIFGLARCCL
jgi:hypothetical protein